MAIKSFQDNLRPPVLGKIRLGEKKESKSGTEYPSNMPHFILKDAPDVAKVYGENPREIDIFFLSDEIDDVIPYWYKWYGGGTRNSEGDIIGGRLYCKGDGVMADWLVKRDPVTRIVPQRPCLADKCPDWRDAKGNQQCKPSMNVYAFVPMASLFGVYQIDTTSKITISRFVSQLTMIKQTVGRLREIPFTIYKEEEAMTYFDQKSGTEKQSKQYILNIRPNQDFFEKHGQKLSGRVQALLKTSTFRATPEMIESPMEDNFIATDDRPAANGSPQLVGQTQNAGPAKGIEDVANDPELIPLFDSLCKLKGKQNTPKIRLLTARQFEKDADPKASLKTYLEAQVIELQSKVSHEDRAADAAHTEPAPPAAQAAAEVAGKKAAAAKAGPQPNSDGLI